MVPPTNVKPRRFKSLLMASDSGVFAGTSLIDLQAFCLGSLPTNPQMYSSNEPMSSCTARNALAFWTAASIFSRLRMKIEAAVQNAKAFLAVQDDIGSFDEYIWGFVGNEPRQNAWRSIKEVPAKTPESDAMSKDLKRRGFTFVGSTICYAFMQAVGMVNDHLVDCFRHGELRQAMKGRR